MADPVRGSEGTAKIGPALSAVPIGKVTEYEYEEETETEDSGPYIGDGTITETPVADKYSLKMTCEVPEGGDGGQDDLLEARSSKARVRLELKTTKGKIITLTNSLVKKASVKVGAKGKQVIEIEASGVGAITQDPVE